MINLVEFYQIFTFTFLFQARKWPDISLKSPGIKPSSRRHNSSANSSLNLTGTLPFTNKAPLGNSNDTGAEQQSPTASSSSSSVLDYSIFAPVNIHSSSSSQHHQYHHHQQQMYNYQHHSQGSMQYYPGHHQSGGGQQQNHHHYNHHGHQHNLSQSVVNLASTADHQMAPEIPRRSDSIILTPSLSSQVQYNLNNSSLSESSSNTGGGSKLVPSPRYPSSSMSALSSSSSGISVSSFYGIMSASNSDGNSNNNPTTASFKHTPLLSQNKVVANTCAEDSPHSILSASGVGGGGSLSMSSSSATNAASIVSLSEGSAVPQPNTGTAISPCTTMSSPSASSSSTVTAVGTTVTASPAPASSGAADIPPAISPRTDKPVYPPGPPPLRNHGGGATEFCYNTSGLPTSPLATSCNFRISSSNIGK